MDCLCFSWEKSHSQNSSSVSEICPGSLFANVFNLNFYPLEVVPRHPQLQVGENYSSLFNLILNN